VLLEQLVQALETNRLLLQRRARRAERAAAKAKEELHELQRTVFSTRDPVAKLGGVSDDNPATTLQVPLIKQPSSTSASSAGDVAGRQAALSPRQLDRCPAALLPPRLLQRVFSFLDPRALVQTAQVCRRWRDLVDEPTLWARLELEYPPLTPQRTPKQIASVRHVTSSTPIARFLVLSADPALQRAKEELQRAKNELVTRGCPAPAMMQLPPMLRASPHSHSYQRRGLQESECGQRL
jgi:hypothetical protein